MKRVLALLLGGVLVIGTAGLTQVTPAAADPALRVTPALQSTDGSDPVKFDIVTSEQATTRCELYQRSTMIDNWSPCTGRVTLDVKGWEQDKYSLRVISYFPGSWKSVWADFYVDRQAPKVKLEMFDGFFVLEDSVFTTWSLLTSEPVPGTVYKRQIRRGDESHWLGQWQKMAPTDERKQVLQLSKGVTACMRVRALDAAGNLGAWSNVMCRARPLDERALDGWSGSSRWKKINEENFINGTGLVATQKGSQLTLNGALTRTLVIWGRKGPYSGRLEIKVDGRVIDTVSLFSHVARRAVLLRKEFASTIRGRIKLTVVSSGKTVTLDAIGITTQ